MSTVSDRTRQRLREEITRKGISQRELAQQLGEGWSQSRVGKLLTGRTELHVDDLAEMCFAIDLSLAEAVRDHGLEFYAEVTPTELRMLERFRELGAPEKDALLVMMKVQRRPEARYRPPKPTSRSKTTRSKTPDAADKK